MEEPPWTCPGSELFGLAPRPCPGIGCAHGEDDSPPSGRPSPPRIENQESDSTDGTARRRTTIAGAPSISEHSGQPTGLRQAARRSKWLRHVSTDQNIADRT